MNDRMRRGCCRLLALLLTLVLVIPAYGQETLDGAGRAAQGIARRRHCCKAIS